MDLFRKNIKNQFNKELSLKDLKEAFVKQEQKYNNLIFLNVFQIFSLEYPTKLIGRIVLIMMSGTILSRQQNQ